MLAAAPEDLGFSASRLTRLDATMQNYVDRGQLPGLVALLARHGQVAYRRQFGFLDVASARPMPPDAIFRIASMTKPITAAAVMMLFEEGHFLLDDPIASAIPEFAATKVYAGGADDAIEVVDLVRPITIRHLLTHTAGLTYPARVPTGMEEPSSVAQLYARHELGRRDETLADKVARLAGMPLVHQPGDGWTYGYSLDVLGRLIEVVSGVTLDVFFKTRLFEPLGMVDTGFHVPRADSGRLASVYTRTGDGVEPATMSIIGDPCQPPIFLMAGGGLLSTATDYAQFALLLAGGGSYQGQRLLGRKTVELMLTSQMAPAQIPFVPPTWGFRNGYGMALGGRTLVDVAQSGLPGSVGSYTWQGAYSTDFWVDQREDLVGVLMVQIIPDWVRPGEMLRLLAYQAMD